MPDLIAVTLRRWKLILSLALMAAVVAMVASLLRPKLYLATATALPANSAVTDRARIFGNNIEGLYSELGSVEELDKMEGTARLDTIYRAAVLQYNLATDYKIDSTKADFVTAAAARLRKSSEVKRTAYGELQVKVWNENPALAATLANALMQNLNNLHRKVQNANNEAVLEKLKAGYKQKLDKLKNGEQLLTEQSVTDSTTAAEKLRQPFKRITVGDVSKRSSFLTEQLQTYQRLIDEYELAVGLNTNPLAVIEPARPTLLPDRPKILQNTLLTFAAGLFFSFLLTVFLESRRPGA